MEEQRKEIEKLKRHVNMLFSMYICLVITLAGVVINLQIQYSSVRSHYQSMVELSRELFVGQESLNSYLEDVNTKLEGYLTKP